MLLRYALSASGRRRGRSPLIILLGGLFITIAGTLFLTSDRELAVNTFGYHAALKNVGSFWSTSSGDDALRQLQSVQWNGTGKSTLVDKAHRVPLFTSLISQIAVDPSADRRPLVTLLQQDYPWFRTAAAVSTPWSSGDAGHDNVNGDEGETTGIVICVGSEAFIYAAHLITTLRNVLDSTIPIQIAYSGDGDLPQEMRTKLVALGPHIETLDLTSIFDENEAELRANGFGQKPFAVLASKFDRVILTDADTVFMQSPDDVFESTPGLAKTGTLFWHDRAQARRESEDRRDWVKQLLGEQEPSQMLRQSLFWQHDLSGEMESGVVCIDKTRPGVFMSLMLAAWMNTPRGGKSEVWAHSYGDKESYWIAAELTGTPYHFEADYAGAIGWLEEDDKGQQRVCSSKIGHTDSRRTPFWFNGSLRFSKHGGARDFTNLTHWATGGVHWPQSQHWDYLDPGMWCIRGPSPIALMDTPYAEPLNKMVEEARLVDDKLLGVP